MKDREIADRLEELLDQTTSSEGEKDWTASQWLAFSRKVNFLISEQLHEAPCNHTGTSYSTASGRRCGTCLRAIEGETNEKTADAGS